MVVKILKWFVCISYLYNAVLSYTPYVAYSQTIRRRGKKYQIVDFIKDHIWYLVGF